MDRTAGFVCISRELHCFISCCFTMSLFQPVYMDTNIYERTISHQKRHCNKHKHLVVRSPWDNHQLRHRHSDSKGCSGKRKLRSKRMFLWVHLLTWIIGIPLFVVTATALNDKSDNEYSWSDKYLPLISSIIMGVMIIFTGVAVVHVRYRR